jgi:hypothetical protein
MGKGGGEERTLISLAKVVNVGMVRKRYEIVGSASVLRRCVGYIRRTFKNRQINLRRFKKVRRMYDSEIVCCRNTCSSADQDFMLLQYM